MNSNILKNVVYNWVGMVAAIIYAFFMTPVVVHGLGDAHYGLWNLIMSCVGYMLMLDFGIQSAMNRFFTRYKGFEDMQGINTMLSNAFILYSFIGLLAFFIGLLITLNIEHIFKIASEDIALTRKIMLLMTIYTACEFPLNILGSLIYSFQRFDVLNIIQAGVLCAQAFLVWIILSRDTSLWLFALAVVFCGLLKYGLQYVFVHRLLPELRFQINLISKDTLVQILTFSGITFLSIITSYLISKTDNIIIGIFLSTQAITMYSIGFMLSEYTGMIVGKMCNTFTPMFSEHEARSENIELKKLLLLTSRLSSLIGIPICLAAFVIGDDFISLWMGKGYHDAYLIMVLLMVTRIVGFPTASMYSMLYGIGKHYIILYTALFEAITNLVLSLILVHYYSIFGVAIGTFIPSLINSIVFPFIVCRKIELGFAEWVREGVLRPGLMCAIFYAIILWGSRHVQAVSWGVLLLQVVFIGAVYLLIVWFLGLRSHERIVLKKKLWLNMRI